MAIFSDFDIFGYFSNVSGIPQSDHYASKSAGYCLYNMLWDYNIIYMPPIYSPQRENPGGGDFNPLPQSRMSLNYKIAQSWQG